MGGFSQELNREELRVERVSKRISQKKVAKTGKEWGISSLTAETFQGPKKNDVRSTVDGSEIR